MRVDLKAIKIPKVTIFNGLKFSKTLYHTKLARFSTFGDEFRMFMVKMFNMETLKSN